MSPVWHCPLIPAKAACCAAARRGGAKTGSPKASSLCDCRPTKRVDRKSTNELMVGLYEISKSLVSQCAEAYWPGTGALVTSKPNGKLAKGPAGTMTSRFSSESSSFSPAKRSRYKLYETSRSKSLTELPSISSPRRRRVTTSPRAAPPVWTGAMTTFFLVTNCTNDWLCPTR